MAMQPPIARIGVPERVFPRKSCTHIRVNYIKIDFMCLIVKHWFNKAVAWLWSWGCAQICGGRVWSCVAHRASLVSQMCTFMGSNMDFFMIFQQTCW